MDKNGVPAEVSSIRLVDLGALAELTSKYTLSWVLELNAA
jgi:hypothetical protein